MAPHLVRLADYEIHVHWLVDPVFEMAVILHIENLAAIALARPQVGISALELNVDPLPAGPAVIVLELLFAVDAVVEHRHRAEDLVRLARNSHHVANENLLQCLRVEFARGRLFHRQDLAGHGVALEPLLDEVDEFDLGSAFLANNRRLLVREQFADDVQVFEGTTAASAHIPPVARDFTGIPGEVAMGILDEDRLQFVGHLAVEVQADRRFPLALLVVDLQTERAVGKGELRRVAPKLPVRKLVAVPQPHDQRGPYRLPLAAERVGDEDVRLMRDVLFPAVLRGKHQVPSLRRLLGDAQRVSLPLVTPPLQKSHDF